MGLSSGLWTQPLGSEKDKALVKSLEKNREDTCLEQAGGESEGNDPS